MQRYDFATKWASIVLGIGAVFVSLGLVILANESLVIPSVITSLPNDLPVLFHQIVGEVIFSLLFYGGIEMAIGISILLFQRFRKIKTEDVVLLNSQLD